jgi:hypothetical protein
MEINVKVYYAYPYSFLGTGVGNPNKASRKMDAHIRSVIHTFIIDCFGNKCTAAEVMVDSAREIVSYLDGFVCDAISGEHLPDEHEILFDNLYEVIEEAFEGYLDDLRSQFKNDPDNG